MKKIQFYLLTGLIVFSLVYATWTGFGLNEEITVGKIVLFLTTLAIGYITGYNNIDELSEKFRVGFLGEYLRFLKRLSVFDLSAKSSDNELNQNTSILLSSVLKFCQDELSKVDELNLIEIADRPFILENKINPRFPKREPLFENPVDHVYDLYNDKVSRCFVTGEAGMGKSHFLKSYIIKLIEQDPTNSVIPIYLPAASWSGNTDAITWIVRTCQNLHHISKSVILDVLETQNIVVFVDGLDEVAIAERAPLLHSLNVFLSKKKLFVSCRKQDFALLQQVERINYQVLCELAPLNATQVAQIIAERLPKERAYLEKSDVYSIFDSPLLIGLLTKVFSSLGPDEKKSLLVQQGDQLKDKLWDKFITLVYVEKKTGRLPDEQRQAEMARFARADTKEGVPFNFSEAELRKFATSLAVRTVDKPFTISDFQPDILNTKSEKLLYVYSSRLIIGLLTSIGLGFLLGGALRFIPAGLLAGGVAASLFYLFNRSAINRTTPAGAQPFVRSGKSTRQSGFVKYIICLLVTFFVLAPYFMLTGLRRATDMEGPFATTDVNIAVIFTVIFFLLTTLSDGKHGLEYDIKLIEKNSYLQNIGSAIVFGLLFALCLSPVIGLFGSMYLKLQPTNAFSGWLSEQSEDWGVSVFYFATIIVAPIALLLGATVGLNNPLNQKLEKREKENQLDFNYSILKTVRNSLFFSLGFAVLGALIWGTFSNVLFQEGWDSINRGIACAISGAVFVGVYWGGGDLLKLTTLRLILYFRGELPLKFSVCLRELELIGVLNRQGAIFKFKHATLYEFLRKQSAITDQFRPLGFRFLYLVGVICGLLILTKIAVRGSLFWEAQENWLEISVAEESQEAIRIYQDTCLVFRDSGVVVLTASGFVSVGRIAGYVTPLGTEIGFFAIPMGDNYNYSANHRHGAIIYTLNEDQTYRGLREDDELPPLCNYRIFSSFKDTIRVAVNDTLKLMINDKEPENNSKHFNLNVKYVNRDN